MGTKRDDDICLRLPQPNGASVSFEYLPLPQGIHVHIVSKHGDSMGISLSGAEVRLLEAFLMQRRILLDG